MVVVDAEEVLEGHQRMEVAVAVVEDETRVAVVVVAAADMVVGTELVVDCPRMDVVVVVVVHMVLVGEDFDLPRLVQLTMPCLPRP